MGSWMAPKCCRSAPRSEVTSVADEPSPVLASSPSAPRCGGSIGGDELFEAPLRISPNPGLTPPVPHHKALELLGTELSKEEVVKLVAELDDDGSGELDFEALHC